MYDLIEALRHIAKDLICQNDPAGAVIMRDAIAEIEALRAASVGVNVGVENERLRDALHNMMGVFDTPIARRRYPPDDFMKECLQTARDALSSVGVNVGVPPGELVSPRYFSRG